MENTAPSRFTAFLDKRYGSTIFTSRQIFAMLLPLIIDQLFIYLIGMLTNAMISTSGQASVTAVSLVSPITMVLMGIFTAVGSGGTILVAQYAGQGNKEKTLAAASQVIIASVVTAVVIAVFLIIFANPLVDMLFPQADEIIRRKGAEFIIGSCISYIPFSVYNSIFSVMRAVGDTKLCLRLTIIINALHLILSFVFINLLALDILGTCLSYILARLVGGVAAFIIIIGHKGKITLSLRDMLKVNFPMLKNIVRLGIPFAVEQIFINVGSIVANMYIATIGSAQMAANAIAASASSLFYGANFAVTALAITVIGQSVGSGDKELARRYGKRMVELGVIISIISLVVFYSVMRFVLILYHPDPETLVIINRLIFIGAIPIPFLWSASYVIPSILRAAGDTAFTSVVCLICMWVCRVLLGYVLTIPLKMGVYGVWVALGAEWLARSVVFAIRMRGTKWLNKKVV